MKNIPTYIIIARTDSLGDMVLALPMAKILKDNFKEVQVFFLGQEYTSEIVKACNFSDGFIDINDFLKNNFILKEHHRSAIVFVKPTKQISLKAKQLKIKYRIGTFNRLYHWTICNKLVRLSRKNSKLHEAQLNLKLLRPFGINKIFSFDEITAAYGLTKLEPLQQEFVSLIDSNKYNLILHPKSRGSSREWPLENYVQLVRMLNKVYFKIFISGIDHDRFFSELLLKEVGDSVIDMQGKIPLGQFISFIAQSDGLVACSTGPLHIAAATGIDTYGIYPPIKPIHPGRWGPIGKKAQVFCYNTQCVKCRNNKQHCICINISPLQVFASIQKQASLKFGKPAIHCIEELAVL